MVRRVNGGARRRWGCRVPTFLSRSRGKDSDGVGLRPAMSARLTVQPRSSLWRVFRGPVALLPGGKIDRLAAKLGDLSFHRRITSLAVATEERY